MSINLDSDTFFSKKVLLPLGIIGGLLILIMIIAGIASNGSSPLKDIFTLNSRITNLTETITTNREYVKSTNLRAATSTLTNVLAATTSATAPITTTDEYDSYANSSSAEEILTTLQEEFTTLNTSLENARLNARLDATYATEIAYQIILLTQLEQSCIDSTTDESVKTALTTSKENLNNLYTDFQNQK